MVPAQQRLEAGDLARRYVDDGLIVEGELASLEGELEICLDLVTLADLVVLAGLEEGEALSPARFRLVERDVDVLQDVIDRPAVLGRKGNSDAGIDLQHVAGHVVRLADGPQQARCQALGVALRLDVALHDGELVAAEPRHQIRAPDGALQAVGHALQQRIANGVAEGVVHAFEIVEIDPVNGNAIWRLDPGEHVLELLAEMIAVRDLGQRVVAGEPGDLLLGAALFGDVLLQIDPAAAGKRLIGDEDGAAVLELLHVGEGPAARELRHVVLDPLALLRDGVGVLDAGFAPDVEAHDVGERRAGPRDFGGKPVDLPVHAIADDEALLGIEHRKPARHVVERDLEPGVELLELLLVLEDLFGVELEGGERLRQVGGGLVFAGGRARLLWRIVALALRWGRDEM